MTLNFSSEGTRQYNDRMKSVIKTILLQIITHCAET